MIPLAKAIVALKLSEVLGFPDRGDGSYLTWIQNRRIVTLSEDEGELVLCLSDRASDDEPEAAIVTVDNVNTWTAAARKFLEGA